MSRMPSYPDKFFDLAIIDAPYGRREHGGKDRGTVPNTNNKAGTFVAGGKYKQKKWDFETPKESFFVELFRISKHQIIWGCNYFQRNWPGSGRIVWDKCNDGSDQSGAEIAYNSITERVDFFRFMWRGMMQGKSIKEGHVMQGNKKLNEKRIHPTQKPVALYQWLLDKYGNGGCNILDTHMGSQSSRIAAYNMGFDYWGWEIDPDYFKDGNKRFRIYSSQQILFERDTKL